MIQLRKPRSRTDARVRSTDSGSVWRSPLTALALRAAALVLGALLLTGIYALTVALPAAHDRSLQTSSALLAQQQAARITSFIDGLERQLAGFADSAAVRSELGSGTPLRRLEDAWLGMLPELLSLRVVTLDEMGTALLSVAALELRNQIELDLIRRAASVGAAAAEYYEVDGQRLVSLAARSGAREDNSTVLLASIAGARLDQLLATTHADQGRSVLRQRIEQGTRDVVQDTASAGSGTLAAFNGQARLADRNWEVVFTPSEQLADTLKPSPVPLLLAWLVLTGVAIAAFAVLILRSHQLLLVNARRLISGEFQRLPPGQMLSPLEPLAKRLRGAALRTNRPSGFAEPAAPASKPAVTVAHPELSDPIFQRKPMVDAEAGTAKVDGNPDLDFPHHIFRAYDIRGIAGRELSTRLAENIARAVGTLAGRQGCQTLLVGSDARLSSPELKTTVIAALLQSGRDVIDIGTVPTPLLYFGIAQGEADSGIMITGSHNPKTHNGMKIVIGGQRLYGDAIVRLRERVLARDFSSGAGHRIRKDLVSGYIERILEDVAIAVPLRVVIDAGNGVSGAIAPHVFEELGCEVQTLYCDLDGNFPNHPPDTSNEDNLQDLCMAVKASHADLGIAFDGDGDRVAVVTSSGRIVRTDQLLMLLARDVVQSNPGADIIFDVKCSHHLAHYITRLGGRPVIWKTGHAPIKAKLDETRAPLGGEFSGHIFFADRWFGFDDGLYAAARLAEMLSASGQTLDEAVAALPGGISTPELLLPVPEDDKFALVEQLVKNANFGVARVNLLDGLRVDYADAWGLVRASNTSAALTLRFEGDDQAALERVQAKFRAALYAASPTLKLPF